MKFQISQHELSSALAKVGGVIPKKASIPVLKMVLLKTGEAEISLTGTNLEITVKTQAKCRVEAPGECLIAFSLLNEITSKLSGGLLFSVDENKMKIVAGNGKYNLPIQAANEFPETTPADMDFNQVISAENIKGIIKNVQFSASTDQLRPMLIGIFFEFGDDFKAVATDRHRLAMLTFNGVSIWGNSVLVPTTTLQLLAKTISPKTEEINFGIGENHIFFRVDNTEISSQMIDGKFPKYESIIPNKETMENRLEIKCSEFLSAINRVGIFANSTNHQVRLSFTEKSVKIESNDAESGGEASEEISCKYEGEPLVIGYNSRLLADALSHIPTNAVIMKLNNHESAAFVLPDTQKDGQEYMQLLMPIRLGDDDD